MMIQKLSALLVTCLLLSCSNAQQDVESDWLKESLCGTVKRLTTTQYKPLSEAATEGAKENLGLLQEDIRVYNAEGFCVEMLHESRGGNIKSRRVLEYNNQHRLISEVHYKGTIEKPVLSNSFEYDEDGDVIQHEYTALDQAPVTTVYTYNENKSIRKGELKNDEGIVQVAYETFFDPAQNIIKDIRFNRDYESMTYATYHRYDAQQRLYCTEVYNPVGNNFSVSKFDEKGQKIEVRKYREGIVTSACQYTYDEKGNETAVSCDLTEANVKRTVKSSMEYEYDEQGNWTRKTTSQEGVVTYVVERQLEYYQD